MVNCSHCGKELSEPLPNFCPDCGKSTIIALNKPQETSRSRENLSIGSLKLLYGKTTLDIGKIKTVGKFTLNEPVNVTYDAAYLYGFNAYKSVTRGNQSIYADEFGYILLSPKDKTVFGLPHAKKGYPKSKDIKDDLDSEYIRIFEDKVAEDDERYLSLIKNLELPELFPPESLTKSLISIVAKNLVVRETYYVQSKKKYDSGARNIDIKFKNQDIRNVQFLGGVAIPMVELYYQHPESDKIVRKKIHGYSQRVVLDEVKCFKKGLLGRECDKAPEIVCPTCGQVACIKHSKKCNKCGQTFCENCIKSKGLISKKNYCKNCM